MRYHPFHHPTPTLFCENKIYPTKVTKTFEPTALVVGRKIQPEPTALVVGAGQCPARLMEPTAIVVGAAAPIPAILRQLAEKEMPEPTALVVGRKSSRKKNQEF